MLVSGRVGVFSCTCRLVHQLEWIVSNWTITVGEWMSWNCCAALWPHFLTTLRTGWWFQRFFIFTPIWGRFPFWLIFFRWVETTNLRKLPFRWMIEQSLGMLFHQQSFQVSGVLSPRKLTWLAGKSTIWRCISYWTWGFSIAVLVFKRTICVKYKTLHFPLLLGRSFFPPKFSCPHDVPLVVPRLDHVSNKGTTHCRNTTLARGRCRQPQLGPSGCPVCCSSTGPNSAHQ